MLSTIGLVIKSFFELLFLRILFLALPLTLMLVRENKEQHTAIVIMVVVFNTIYFGWILYNMVDYSGKSLVYKRALEHSYPLVASSLATLEASGDDGDKEQLIANLKMARMFTSEPLRDIESARELQDNIDQMVEDLHTEGTN